MGDRGVIAVRQSQDRDIVLYTHWGATELEEMLKSVLSRKARWNDGPYLTRMIFDEMTREAHSDETGYGIQVGIPGDVWRVLNVHIAQQTVELIDHGEIQYKKTFEGFID